MGKTEKVWQSHTSCGFTAYAPFYEIGIPHLYRWGRKSIGKCFTERQFKENDKNAEVIIAKNNLYKNHKGVINFLYMSDCGGKVSHKTCKQIYEIIKNIDFGNKSFRYAKYSKNDYEEFKEFLKECYSKHRNMRWY